MEKFFIVNLNQNPLLRTEMIQFNRKKRIKI